MTLNFKFAFMISVQNLSLYFGGQDIFNGISFMVNKGDKIGLVGRNGSGKSTLLKLLSDNIEPNSGKILRNKGLTIGYLKQDFDFKEGCTVIEETYKAFKELEKIKKRINEINKQLEERNDFESKFYLDLVSELSQQEDNYRFSDGNKKNAEISQVLLGLGFFYSDFNRKTDEFSGGWRMRIELAKILLKKPDILLLDEPTNHLDLDSIIWLEKWLKNFNGSVVLVSHDREFLDIITNRTIEIAFSKINDYKANFSKYLNLRKDRIEKQIQAKNNQDKYIRDTEILINKFRAKKNKASFAQSLIRKINKIEIIQVEKEDFSKMNFKFPPAPRSGKISLRVKNVYKSYNDLKVLNNINLELARGEKIAFVGKNGEGKSTLAKIIVNLIKYEGSVSLGHNVKCGYYAQNQSDFLNQELSIIETIEESSLSENNVNFRDILGSFLFSNDEIEKKIKVLSGGERARVSLCKLLLSPINLLVMDEPTNHLDMVSKEILKKSLIDFDGSLIIISHDREFLQGLTTKVYEFKEMNIKEFSGDINDFLKERSLSDINHINKSIENNLLEKKAHNKSFYNQEKERKKAVRKLKSRINNIEIKINELEKKLKQLDLDFLDISKSNKLSHDNEIFTNYKKVKEKLEKMEKEWDKSINDLEDLNI